MNDLAPILMRVAAINPVPDENDLPASAIVGAALLTSIEERTRTMQTQQSQTKRPDERIKRRRGVVIAMATFAVVVVVGASIAFIGSQTSDVGPGATDATEVVLVEDVVTRLGPQSMADTIQPGAELLVDRSAYVTRSPERLDIVLYADVRVSDTGTAPELVTRVIGLPGETIESREGKVYVNDRSLDEPYLMNPQVPMSPFGPITLGVDELWLMGDNRQVFGDSGLRGPIAVSLLRAKVVEILNP
ncbi:MAG: signal peptidase I [Actinomycetia bacterium]|nr:signal peptidase I [Actinomycetes bacterium]